MFDLYLPAAYLPSNGALTAAHVLVRAAAAAVGSAAVGSLAAAVAVSSTENVHRSIRQGVPQGSFY